MELEHADRDVGVRSQDDLHGVAHGLPLDRPRRHLAGVQSGPDREPRPRVAADDGRARPRARPVAARRRHRVLDADDDQRVAARREAALHRQRRRAANGDEGRRPEMDDAQRADSRVTAADVCQQRPAVATRGGHGLRDLRRPLQRRLPRLRLRQRRLRAALAIDCRRSAGSVGAPAARAPAQRAAAVSRPRARHSLFDRRRRQLDAADSEHAGRAGRRHPDPPARQRPDCRHARARHLGARQHLGARGVDAGSAAERSVPRAAGARAPARHLQSSGVVRRRAVLRAESGFHRRDRLLPPRRLERRAARDDLGEGRRGGADAGRHRPRRPQPRLLGPAPGPAGAGRPSRHGRGRRLRRAAARTARAAGHLHRHRCGERTHAHRRTARRRRSARRLLRRRSPRAADRPAEPVRAAEIADRCARCRRHRRGPARHPGRPRRQLQPRRRRQPAHPGPVRSGRAVQRGHQPVAIDRRLLGPADRRSAATD